MKTESLGQLVDHVEQSLGNGREMTDFEQHINQRITELENQRDQFVQQANQQVAAFNGAIAELKRLLEPPKPEVAIPVEEVA